MIVLRLAFSNIRKKKGAAISLVVLVTLAVIFLNTGLSNLIAAAALFDSKVCETKAPHNLIIMKNSLYKPSYYEFFNKDERVKKVVVQDGIFMKEPKMSFSGGELITNAIFLNYDKKNLLEEVHLQEAIDHPGEDAIYLPISLKNESYGYVLGGTISFVSNQKKFTFQIAGFYETLVYGIPNVGAYKYLLTDGAYEKLYGELGGIKIIGVTLNDAKNSEQIEKEFMTFGKAQADSSQNFEIIFDITYTLAKMCYTTMIQLLCMLLTSFSVVIVIVVLLVIRYRIVNNIEDNLKNIGVLGALGYTSREIIASYIAENGILSITGALLGTGIAYMIGPVVGSMNTSMSGLIWHFEWHFLVDLIGIIIVTVFIVSLSYMAARRVKKYPPVVALTGGDMMHQFRRNYFGLEKTRYYLCIRLAAKNFMAFLKQNVMIMICVVGLSFATLFSILLFVNLGIDQTAFKNLLGFEVADISLSLNQNVDTQGFKEELAARQDVRKVVLTKNLFFTSLMGEQISTVVFEDYNALETLKVIQGRFPKYDNEVMLTGVVADKLGKVIGDTISVEYEGYSFDFIITGITQTLSNAGKNIYFTEAAIKHIYPSYKGNVAYVYLKDDIRTEDFIKDINKTYGISAADVRGEEKEGAQNLEQKIRNRAEEKLAALMTLYDVNSVDYSVMVDGIIISGSTRQFIIEDISNIENQVETSIGGYKRAIASISMSIVLATSLIIILILSLVIKAMIIKQKVNLGIYRGLGYTTLQLILYIALSIMPAVVFGVAGGFCLTCISLNKILSYGLYSFGISNMQFAMSPAVILITGTIFILFAFIITLLNASRVRTISVYQLLTE